MTASGLLAVGVGAALGAWLRWALGLLLNGLFPAVPPGTLAANLLGAYVIGVGIAFFAQMPQLAPEWRLLIVTGFCGALTTFSTFSAELSSLFQQGRFGVLAGAVAVHVAGSLAMTLAGMGTVQVLSHR
ncbi:fluoride efflux transporter CrcB [Solimonas marina]|uniref:Fluoride-specific ion channel FluC n=1 Tax=Solimonas marina TaxID=2714601 RepID=A0A969WD02_9GAMM|nr:fluoride efflux transporter CrcB [Solimonas marina]NKF23748.1 fluoride efflux transporter CrcB [Solimonas marina]